MKYLLKGIQLGQILILCILTIGLSSIEVAGQGNAQATMRVSVEVINSPNFTLDTPKNLLTANRNILEKGSIRLDRTVLHQINLPKNIKLKDFKEGKLELNNNKHIKQSDPNSIQYYLEVDFIEQLKGNKHMGQLQVSVEYL